MARGAASSRAFVDSDGVRLFRAPAGEFVTLARDVRANV